MADWGKKRDRRGLGSASIDYSGTLTAGIAEVSPDKGSGQIRVHNFWCTLDRRRTTDASHIFPCRARMMGRVVTLPENKNAPTGCVTVEGRVDPPAVGCGGDLREGCAE